MNITKVKVKGFRGFTKEKTIDFSSPVVILYGENGRGKSSILNAIEWCLFGKESVGGNTGIRERIDWEVKNRFFEEKEESFVEVEIEKNEKRYVLKRTWLSPKKDEVSLKLPEGTTLCGEEAEKELSKLLSNYSFKDFMSCVYQHQEVIRFILTQEPKDRNEALDRLFGLSDYRNIIDGIEDAKIKGDTLKNELDRIEKEINTKLEVWSEQIEKKTNELGKEEIGEEDLKETQEKIKNYLENFSKNSKINLSEEFKSLPEDDFKKFIDVTKNEIKRLRGEIPEEKIQRELFEKLKDLQTQQITYEKAKENLKRKEEELNKFIKENGDFKIFEDKKINLEKKIKDIEEEKEKITLLGTLFEKAIKYLESDFVLDKETCPLCKNRKVNLLLELKEEFEQKFKNRLQALDKELKKSEEELKNIESLIKDYKKLEEVKKQAQEEFDKIGTDLRENLKIGKEDDPLVHIEKQIKDINKELENLKKVIAERASELNKVEEEIEKLKKMGEILTLKAQRDKAQNIKNTEEWKKLEEKSTELQKLANRIEKIKKALAEASHEKAKEIIESVSDKINNYFKRITNHSGIEKLVLKVEERAGKNDYKFYDQKNKEVTPILSQGQYNSLALSIFTAMGELYYEKNPFKFIMFDDPSQSLGRTEKERFIEILNEISNVKKLIIATMDSEFYEALKKNLTKSKKYYLFSNWTPEEGPIFKEEI